MIGMVIFEMRAIKLALSKACIAKHAVNVLLNVELECLQTHQIAPTLALWVALA